MGGTLWELVKLMCFYKEFNKKPIIWGKFFLKFSMISSDGFNHGLSCGNHLEPSESMRCNSISRNPANQSAKSISDISCALRKKEPAAA